MFRRLIAVSVVALCVGAGLTTAQTPPAPDVYVWHGELVSADPAARTLTVKAHVLADVAKEVGQFKAGERVLVTWSGLDRNAGAVRRVTRAQGQVSDPFSLPVELVSNQVADNYVTVRFQAPESAFASVKALKPGEWITITARQRGGDAQAIVSVEPYVKGNPTS